MPKKQQPYGWRLIAYEKRVTVVAYHAMKPFKWGSRKVAELIGHLYGKRVNKSLVNRLVRQHGCLKADETSAKVAMENFLRGTREIFLTTGKL